MATEAIEAQRRSVPTSHWVRSECPDGVLMSMNVFIEGSKLDEYIKIATPVVHKFRESKECMFCEISVHPQDKGHVRVLHGWTKTSDWFREVSFDILLGNLPRGSSC